MWILHFFLPHGLQVEIYGSSLVCHNILPKKFILLHLLIDRGRNTFKLFMWVWSFMRKIFSTSLLRMVVPYSWNGLGNMASTEAMRLFVKLLEVSTLEPYWSWWVMGVNLLIYWNHVDDFNRKKILLGIQEYPKLLWNLLWNLLLKRKWKLRWKWKWKWKWVREIFFFTELHLHNYQYYIEQFFVLLDYIYMFVWRK